MDEQFTQYSRKQIAELADWTPGFDMTGVSVSDADKQAGSPKLGDKIARNPANHADRWLVAADYFAVNFEAVTASVPSVVRNELVAQIDELEKKATPGNLTYTKRSGDEVNPASACVDVDTGRARAVFMSPRYGLDRFRHDVEFVSALRNAWPQIRTGLLSPVVRNEALDGELWHFFRSTLEQGAAIQMDYHSGRKYPTYEHYAARIDEAARERAEAFAALQSSPAEGVVVPVEPTEEMANAFTESYIVKGESFKDGYKAMLSARPEGKR